MLVNEEFQMDHHPLEGRQVDGIITIVTPALFHRFYWHRLS